MHICTARMNLEYLAIAIVALAAAACAGPTHSPPPAQNRYHKTGNNADRATDLKRENIAASTTATKNLPQANGETLDRTKKAIAPWDAEHTEYQSHTFTRMSIWRPPVYALNRPYFIPIYGPSGGIPIYFAPQPFGGQDKPPYMGPAYLPPKEQPESTQAPSVNVVDRFNYDDDDDRPIWNKGSSNSISDSDKPARPPADNSIHLSAADENMMREIFKIRPTQSAQQPPRTIPTTTTSTPPPTQDPPGPSNCVWAVVSCCSADTNVYPERCFEQRGCPGPFWGGSPCDTEFAKAAVAAALKYYNP
ncbi:uncharacterized protein LOC130448722 isoform X2 [Diorhabda sublineata]|uniref:uncharacterized protein LOC130448722 isoform X2 n=1 Tax=Diorhabda sublineata TaxID=1163346 RepID=UPI0024E12551|nr:uncharacterized protein LOC130448722 isoform X2 [Diorhabda sublineata]